MFSDIHSGLSMVTPIKGSIDFGYLFEGLFPDRESPGTPLIGKICAKLSSFVFKI